MKIWHDISMECYLIIFAFLFSRSLQDEPYLVSVVLGDGDGFCGIAARFFTDDAFSGAHGQASFTSEEYGITLTASPDGAELTRSSAGLGVDYSRFIIVDLPYEIDYPEVLTISFDKEVNLESVFISNLYTDGFVLWREKGSMN